MTTAVERNKNDGTPKVLRVSREFARVDSAIAHVYSYHLDVRILHIFGSIEQKENFYTETINN